MTFSIVIPTLNRQKDLLNMLESLVHQDFKDFEVLVIDQNQSDLIDDICRGYQEKINLKQIKIEPKGASNARNVGINNAKGTFIGFPDDDCEYLPHTLNQVLELLQTDDIVMIATEDKEDGHAISRLSESYDKKTGINKKNILQTVVEPGIFINKKVIGEQRFDENMGVGSLKPYWSDEGPDFILNLIKTGAKGFFYPQIKIYHPNPIKIYNDKTSIRAYNYGKGRGYYLKKHKYPINVVMYYFGVYIAGMILGILKFDGHMFKYFVNGLKGRYEGYFLSK